MNQFITLRGVRLHFYDWGNPSYPSLVLLHGGAAHTHWWDHIAPVLAERYYVIALDLRGHGDSDWVVPPAYEIEDYVSDVEEICSALNLVSPVVVGHSLGGFIALTYATRHAKTLYGLIVVDIGFRLKSSRMMRLLRDMPAPHYQDEDEVLQRFQLLPTETFAAPPLLHHIARTSVRVQETGGFTLKFDRATMVRTPRDLSLILEKITCPTLLLRGSHSQHFAVTTMTEMVERCPRARGVEIPEAGHHVFLDNPTAFLNAVGDFLREEVEGCS
jgi:pimeloyl-ACP methyl ester carboxylesterase